MPPCAIQSLDIVVLLPTRQHSVVPQRCPPSSLATMRCQLRPSGLTSMRICHNALAVRPHAMAKVSLPRITRRSAAVGSSGSRRAQEYGDEEEDSRPWELDNLTSLAHSELDMHREARHYARIAAYEMPRLAGNANTLPDWLFLSSSN